MHHLPRYRHQQHHIYHFSVLVPETTIHFHFQLRKKQYQVLKDEPGNQQLRRVLAPSKSSKLETGKWDKDVSDCFDKTIMDPL